MRARKAKSEQYRRYTYKWWREKRGTWNTPCEVCGELRNSELAHIIPRKDGGTMDKNNLLVLCPNHHKILDNHIIKNLGNQFTAEEYAKISARVELLIPPRLV
jgi:predicted restriction endonuclease